MRVVRKFGYFRDCIIHMAIADSELFKFQIKFTKMILYFIYRKRFRIRYLYAYYYCSMKLHIYFYIYII